jgi:hypothetical protein
MYSFGIDLMVAVAVSGSCSLHLLASDSGIMYLTVSRQIQLTFGSKVKEREL